MRLPRHGAIMGTILGQVRGERGDPGVWWGPGLGEPRKVEHEPRTRTPKTNPETKTIRSLTLTETLTQGTGLGLYQYNL